MYKKITAETISKIFDPVMLALVILLVAIYKSHMPTNITIAWMTGVVFFNGFIPYLFYLKYLKKGYNFDTTLNHDKHRERIKIFDVLLVAVIFEFIVSYFTGGYQPLLAVFTGGLISLILAMIVTYYWKISLHASVITFFVVMVIIIYGINYWYIAFSIPLVFWSRLYLKRHTILQLLAGFFLALVVMLEVFFIYGII